MSRSPRTVVVTGASTGIGRATALRLAGAGHTVLAGVRRDADADGLRAEHRRIEPVLMDVTDADGVARLGERATAAGASALVNNAGVLVAGPLEAIDVDALRGQFEVNLFAQVAVTQAVLPALRASGRGRLVNVSSIGAIAAPPYVGAYTASKAALLNLTVVWRRELAPWGIGVTAIVPGSIATEIWRKGDEDADAVLDALSPEHRRRYGTQLQALRTVSGRTARLAVPADRVAKAIASAIEATRPRPVVMVGPDAHLMRAATALLPARVIDAGVALAMGLRGFRGPA